MCRPSTTSSVASRPHQSCTQYIPRENQLREFPCEFTHLTRQFNKWLNFYVTITTTTNGTKLNHVKRHRYLSSLQWPFRKKFYCNHANLSQWNEHSENRIICDFPGESNQIVRTLLRQPLLTYIPAEKSHKFHLPSQKHKNHVRKRFCAKLQEKRERKEATKKTGWK